MSLLSTNVNRKCLDIIKCIDLSQSLFVTSSTADSGILKDSPVRLRLRRRSNKVFSLLIGQT